MHEVYLSLGSNIGDKKEYLARAIDLLDEKELIAVEKISKLYETSPVGEVVQDDFYNLALKVSTSYTPLELLRVIQEVEQKLDRVRTVHWGPRTIDIDILFYGDLIMEEAELTLPHKEVFHRLFVLVPLMELLDTDFIYFEKMKETISLLERTQQRIREVEDGK